MQRVKGQNSLPDEAESAVLESSVKPNLDSQGLIWQKIKNLLSARVVYIHFNQGGKLYRHLATHLAFWLTPQENCPWSAGQGLKS